MSIWLNRTALILAGHDNRPVALTRSTVARLRDFSLCIWATGPFAWGVEVIGLHLGELVIHVEDGSARESIA